MGRQTSIEKSAVEKLKKCLKAAPIKEPDCFTLDSALAELKPVIDEAIAKGYSQQDIIAMASKVGIDIKPYHMRKLMRKTRQSEENQ